MSNAFREDRSLLFDLDDALEMRLSGTIWGARVADLEDDTPFEERITLYQSLRGAAVLPHEATFFLIAWAVQTLADERAAELLESRYEERFAAMEAKYGFDSDACEDLTDIPQDYEALNLEFGQAAQSLLVATFQTFGEHKMAALLRRTPGEFTRQYTAGYEYFMGPDEPDELDRLLNLGTMD